MGCTYNACTAPPGFGAPACSSSSLTPRARSSGAAEAGEAAAVAAPPQCRGSALLPLPDLPGCATGGECAAGGSRGQQAAWTQGEGEGGGRQGAERMQLAAAEVNRLRGLRLRGGGRGRGQEERGSRGEGGIQPFTC